VVKLSFYFIGEDRSEVLKMTDSRMMVIRLIRGRIKMQYCRVQVSAKQKQYQNRRLLKSMTHAT
jgi:hypothetical protein